MGGREGRGERERGGGADRQTDRQTKTETTTETET